MSLFYNKKENDKEIIITFKYNAIYYYSFFILIVIFMISKDKNTIINLLSSFLFITMVLVKTITHWDINNKIKNAMKKGDVKVSGSNFSLSNPVVFKIQK